jgi:hypothetical protein
VLALVTWFRVATEVDWSDECRCFEAFVRETADFYSVKDKEGARFDPEQHSQGTVVDWRETVEHVVYPAIKCARSLNVQIRFVKRSLCQVPAAAAPVLPDGRVHPAGEAPVLPPLPPGGQPARPIQGVRAVLGRADCVSDSSNVL